MTAEDEREAANLNSELGSALLEVLESEVGEWQRAAVVVDYEADETRSEIRYVNGNGEELRLQPTDRMTAAVDRYRAAHDRQDGAVSHWRFIVHEDTGNTQMQTDASHVAAGEWTL